MPAPPVQGQSLPSFEALAAMASPHVASFAEATRQEREGDEPMLASVTLPYDACLRAAFTSEAPLEVAFTSPQGTLLGSPASGDMALVPATGPVCGRAGDTLVLSRLPADGGKIAASRPRVIVWISPKIAPGP